MQLFVVDFKERALDDDLGFMLAGFFFVEDLSDDAWDYAEIFFLHTDRVTTAHREGLTGSSLAVRQDSGIEANETAENQVAHTAIKDDTLLRVNAECFIESESAVLSHYDLVLLFIRFDTDLGAFAQLFTYEWSYAHGHSDRASISVAGVCEKAIGVRFGFFGLCCGSFLLSWLIGWLLLTPSWDHFLVDLCTQTNKG